MRFAWGSERAPESDTYSIRGAKAECTAWVLIQDTPFLAALIFSQNHGALLAPSQPVYAQLPPNTRCDGAVHYATMRNIDGDIFIGAIKLHPHGSPDGEPDSSTVAVQTSNLHLPPACLFRPPEAPSAVSETRRITGGMRMNQSLLSSPDLRTVVSIVTAGDRAWDDKCTPKYTESLATTVVSASCSPPNFTICTSNRLAVGDCDILKGLLNQTCVDKLNAMLPLLSDDPEESILARMRLAIGGDLFGRHGKLVVCRDRPDAVLAPVVLIQRPRQASIDRNGQLACETTMLLLDTSSELALSDNPTAFGDMLLLCARSDNVFCLHDLRSNCDPRTVTMVRENTEPHDLRTCRPAAAPGQRAGRISTALRVHALRDWLCGIDLCTSSLVTFQTIGDTLETKERKEAITAFRTCLAAFNALKRLLNGTTLSERAVMNAMPAQAASASAFSDRVHTKLREARACVLATGCSLYAPAHLSPLRHSQRLGPIHNLCILASGDCNSPTDNRAVLLVQTQSPPDVVVLFVDRHLGTDPEYFSSDPRMRTTDLHTASSVRACLCANGLIAPNEPLCVRSVTRLSSRLTQTFRNKNGHRVHGKMHTLFVVHWKKHPLNDEWQQTVFSVFTSNRTRTDMQPDPPIGRIVTSTDANGNDHAAFNPEWRIRIASRE